MHGVSLKGASPFSFHFFFLLLDMAHEKTPPPASHLPSRSQIIHTKTQWTLLDDQEE